MDSDFALTLEVSQDVIDAMWAVEPYWLALFGSLEKVLLIALIAVPLQALFPATRRAPKFRSYEFWLDLLYSFQPALLGFIGAYTLAVGTTGSFLLSHTPVVFPGLAEWPFALQVVLSVWMFDFLVYWRHRLEHMLPFLWPIHAVHHTTEQVDFLTTLRLHPLEFFLGVIITGVSSARMGLSTEAVAMGFAIYIHYNYFIHANVNVKFPGFLKYVFVSPFMHRWHHASEEDARDRNFGVIFAWNDWLFGSAYHPAREPHSYGIQYPSGEEVGQSYLAQLLYPFRVGYVRLRRRLTAPAAASEA